MTAFGKLEYLVGDAQFDVCSDNGKRYGARSALHFIHRAAMPGKGHMPLFKVMLTNICSNDCAYCSNQVGRDRHRMSFSPDELAKTFMEMHAKRLVRGLFLTSGVAGNASRTMEAMVKTVDILRHSYRFEDYIHLKIMPGASFDCIEAGCRLASRVSVNMEAPTAHHLARLSSKKNIYSDILERMQWVKQLMAANRSLVPSGQTTQFVVGAAGETDADILHTMEALYSEVELRRVYYSAFKPVHDSRLEGVPPTPPMREHRLYQADWLVRAYGFAPQELDLALGENGHLSLKKDPKQVIAQKQPWLYPIDVNKASYTDLLRVPGIGPISAQRIVETRQDHSIYSIDQLKKMRVATKRAAKYIWFTGMLDWERQLSFLPDFEFETIPSPSLTMSLR
jgi:predicted DNA-binding helix-hairpin-helix protein